MDAPFYPPSDHYEAPERVPEPLTTATGSLADFLANPQATAILFEELPGFKMMVATPMIKPHLGNMSPRTMIQFSGGDPARFDKIDARLMELNIMIGTRP